MRAPLATGCALLAACSAPPAVPGPELGAWLPPAASGAVEVAPRDAPEGARVIDLHEVLTLAADHGLLPQLSREAAAEARAEEDVARAAWLPRLGLGTSFFQHRGQLQNTEGLFLDVDKQHTFLGADLTLEVDLGEAIFAPRAARERSAAARHAVRAADRDTLAAAAFRYFDLVEAHARLQIAEKAVQHAGELVAHVEARVRGGTGLDADLALAQARLAAARRGRIQAEGETRIASASLAELLQLDASTRLVPAGERPATLELVAPRSIDELLETARSNRPELAAAAAELRAREEEERAAGRDWWLPELQLSATGGALGPNYGALKDEEIFTAGVRWELGAHLLGERLGLGGGLELLPGGHGPPPRPRRSPGRATRPARAS